MPFRVPKGIEISATEYPSRIAAYKDKIRFVSLYRKNKITEQSDRVTGSQDRGISGIPHPI